MSFQDHFSTQAASYAAARPGYPAALFDHLLALVGSGARVWEAACGSGQATVDLAARFAHVHASEPSAAALAHAPLLDRVAYNCAPAEQCALGDASVDLVVVAQALHWFDETAFFNEVDRVLRPSGVLAVWCYQDVVLPPELVATHAPFAAAIAPWWPPQRQLIDDGYASVSWPFEPLPAPPFELQAAWELPRLLAYFRSYSAVARYQQACGGDPVDDLAQALAKVWTDPARPRTIRWPMPLFLRRKGS
jgi:SAM-dependent methyltransferase